jgi:hypothetical protein
MSTARGLPPENTDGDAAYLEKTLRHAPTDLLLDASADRELVRATWSRLVKVFLGINLVATVLSFANDGDGFVGGFFLSIIVCTAYWLVFLSREKSDAISEWCTLLAGRAKAADSVYSHIVGALRDRQLPIQHRIVRRTLTEFGARGNRLVLVQDTYFVYVTVFSYGTSLYLGWTMWRVRKGRDLVRQYDHAQRHGHDPIRAILHLEQLKAMREAVHAVCREALHLAVKEIHVAESYGFPDGMPPIENAPYRKAPRPGGGREWPPPPTPPPTPPQS